ncbi:lanthionine synthetase C family protein [Streptomyces sp. NPDC058476]|uniref:lanthionine synthetase C family protein n=1 Tax=Streptomyces sp. NPDC058476 TaxID=3346519 RepID=UPI0036463227
MKFDNSGNGAARRKSPMENDTGVERNLRAELRSKAEDIFLHVLTTLTSWERAVNNTTVTGPFTPGTIDERKWSHLSLANGFPGVSLLFTECAASDRSFKTIAHDYFGQARRHMTAQDLMHNGLFHGVGAFAFSVNAAQRAFGGYRSALESLDVVMRKGMDRVLSSAGHGVCSSFQLYDAISGLSGVGRYFLHRPTGENVGPLQAALRYCVSLADFVEEDGAVLPKWWVRHQPNAYTPKPRARNGHGNFGLAHGIAGPLALLSESYSAGITVDGQADAMRHFAAALQDWRVQDEYGFYWPPYTSFTIYTERHSGPVDPRTVGHRGRPSWCYGAPGVSHALMRAGQVLGERSYCDTAVESIKSMLAVPYGEMGIADASICHGWAGLLHVLRRFERIANIDFSDEVDHIASLVMDEFDPTHAFGFQFAVMDKTLRVNSPGFLDGAAGVALALKSYASDDLPASSWDSALLVS